MGLLVISSLLYDTSTYFLSYICYPEIATDTVPEVVTKYKKNNSIYILIRVINCKLFMPDIFFLYNVIKEVLNKARVS